MRPWKDTQRYSSFYFLLILWLCAITKIESELMFYIYTTDFILHDLSCFRELMYFLLKHRSFTLGFWGDHFSWVKMLGYRLTYLLFFKLPWHWLRCWIRVALNSKPVPVCAWFLWLTLLHSFITLYKLYPTCQSSSRALSLHCWCNSGQNRSRSCLAAAHILTEREQTAKQVGRQKQTCWRVNSAVEKNNVGLGNSEKYV